VKCLKHCTPHMVVKWVEVGRIWWPLVLCDEVGTVSPQPVMRLTGRVRRSAVLLIYESKWKQLFAVVNEHWQQTSNIICRIHPKPKTIPELKSALQQIWDELPWTTINKAISDFRKRLNSRVSADGRHFEHTMWTSYWNMLTELCGVLVHKMSIISVLNLLFIVS